MSTSIRTVFLLASAFVLGPVHAQPDPATVMQSAVQVVVTARNDVRRAGSGFAVAPGGHIVTAAHLVADEETIAVVPLASRTELVARVAYADEVADVAVLAVNGLDLPPLEVALDGFDPGRRVYSAGVWPQSAGPLFVAEAGADVPVQLAEGAVGARTTQILEDETEPVEIIEHNAMIPAAGYGGPLLNECGQAAGVNRSTPGVSAARLRRGEAPEGAVSAAGLSDVLQWLRLQQIEVVLSDTSCADLLTATQAEARETAEQLEQRQQEIEQERLEREQTESALEEAQQEQEQTQQALEQTQQELDQAAAAAGEAEARVGELETQYEEALRAGDEQAETLREELEAARTRQAEAQSVVTGMEEEVAALQARLGEQASANRMRLVAAGSAGVLVMLVGFVFYRRRSRELAVAREQAELARREASAAIEAAREPEPGFDDCWIAGETGDGTPVSIKVPGALLGVEGVVLGRSPRNSTFLISDPTLSREHARLYSEDGSLFVEDLRTTNGTWINGRRIDPQSPGTIRPGDVIELGGVKLRFDLAK